MVGQQEVGSSLLSLLKRGVERSVKRVVALVRRRQVAQNTKLSDDELSVLVERQAAEQEHVVVNHLAGPPAVYSRPKNGRQSKGL